MKVKRFQILIIGIILIMVSACDKNRIFEKYAEISPEGWHKNIPVSFEIPVSDSISNHNLYINVRNDINYMYSNLWLFIESIPPQGITTVDTFEVLLAEPSGKWLGDGFGGKKTLQTSFKQNIQFPVSGDYKVNIYQGMRDENLEGINDVGFRVEKSN